MKISDKFILIDNLLEKNCEETFINTNILVEDKLYHVDWIIDFSEYSIIKRDYQVPQKILETINENISNDIKIFFEKCDFEVLAYYTCNSLKYLQNHQDNMDWIFYIDYYLDSGKQSDEEVKQSLYDLIIWTKNRKHKSSITWVNNANLMLKNILEELESNEINTDAILENTRYYYKSLLKENDKTMFQQEYLENRMNTIGVYPTLAYCFAYTGCELSAEDFATSVIMKHLTSIMIGLENDLFSLYKEANEPNYINLRMYYSSVDEFLRAVTTTYENCFKAFISIKPQESCSLLEHWRVCNQWICGSLLWHMTSRRYNFLY
ncbi:hypothetical protein H6G97_36500 [Nostoc flagelliforme FACHB-838]|uniref:Terpene synthase n=1 Tax=Nostoc flagelliforme FACHB-838 TaxID=2692904 RepID=A0ABR8DZQ7_9NOSO|nr:terpene synthase family protein [Nostoc flagelliforme]MBD2534683.1 hypothetical protein [Nostoc flagelliforme FACHB-838]